MVTFTPSGIGKLTLDPLKNIQDISKLGLGKFPQGTPPGTVPIGDNSGFYKTPNTPPDPQDCTRWPDSPWCGGIPIDTKPFAYNIDAQVHGCGFDVTIGSTAFFVKGPQFKLSYRYEGECRKEPPPPPPPPPPPGRSLSIPTNIASNTLCYVFWHEPNDKQPSEWTAYVCPGETEYINNTAYPSEITGIGVYSWHQYGGDPYQLLNARSGYRRTASPPYGTYYEYNYTADGALISYWRQGSTYTLLPNTPIADTVGVYWYGGNVNQGLYISKGRWGAIYNDLVGRFSGDVAVDFVVEQGCSPYNPYKNNPPPDPPDKDCKCMSCCNDPRDKSPDYSSLLRQILAEIKKANTAIGSDKWPNSKVPANLLVRDGLSNAQMAIPDIVSWCEWYSKQFDSLMGRWKIDLQVDHPDPTDPKAKPVKMALPNLAESVAEMMGVLIHISMNVDALTNVGTRTLIQSGQASQQAFTNWMLLNAIQEYMGFADEDDVREMVLAFKPNETDLSKLLKETHVKVKGVKFKKDTQRLRDALHDLLRGAAIISAVHWRKLDSNKKNYGQQLFDLISGTAGLVSKIGDPKNKVTGDSDFDAFIKDFEEGFMTSTGLDKDLKTNPYGRPYDERPQVKKLGKAPTPKPPTNQ